ncbi:MAG: BspA family leucine-rich repeat surface protein [Cellulosilyticaceae bacterium]
MQSKKISKNPTILTMDISMTKKPTLYIKNDTGKPLIINWGDGGDTEILETTMNAITKTYEYPEHQRKATITISRADEIIENDDKSKIYTLGSDGRCLNGDIISIFAGKGSSVGRCSFVDARSLKEAYLKECNTDNVEDMSDMFNGCHELLYVDLQCCNNPKVKNMSNMFSWCNKLKNINLSKFKTPQVENMASMFAGCRELESLDVGGFDTQNVKSMECMFAVCRSLEKLDLSTFHTPKLENMSNMFEDCISMKELNISGLKTRAVKNMVGTFCECSSLKKLDVSGFKTKKVTSMMRMFAGCSSLEELNVRKFDTKNVEDMWQMFYKCSSLTKLRLKSFNTANVKDMHQMFYMCSSLKKLDLSTFDTSKVEDMSRMFSGCSRLKTLCLDNFNTKSIRMETESEVDMIDAIFCHKIPNNKFIHGMEFMFSVKDDDRCFDEPEPKQLNSLKKITLGEKFKFKGENSFLPIPNKDNIPGADGEWYDIETSKSYEPKNVHKNAKSKKTYVATKIDLQYFLNI